jgi:protein-ribulosamine 3-kinase
MIKELSDILHEKVTDIKIASGGSINDSYLVTCEHHSYFVKCNEAIPFKENFEAEIKGLKLLASTNTLRIPSVVRISEHGEEVYLILEMIHKGHQSKKFWEQFGQSLASLHRNTHPFFGLDHDNYIGALAQSNSYHKNWIEFFHQERILPQLQSAEKAGLISISLIDQFEKLIVKLPDIFPEEPPALIHGDLWNGNMMADEQEQPVVFDPAVYYGHREMDIAMSKLFGGFDPYFYYAYHEVFPMHGDWEHRMELYNLYPLLVHVNLFGGQYLSDVKVTLNKIIS